MHTKKLYQYMHLSRRRAEVAGVLCVLLVVLIFFMQKRYHPHIVPLYNLLLLVNVLLIDILLDINMMAYCFIINACRRPLSGTSATLHLGGGPKTIKKSQLNAQQYTKSSE